MRLSADHARRLVLQSQMLWENPENSSGKQRTTRIIDHLGYIQIDTISVVQRAHHHTLWTRYSGYHPDMLHKLQAVDREIFEYWGHAASYLPMRDYRYYTYRMKNFSDPMDKWAKDRLKKCGHLMDEVLSRIRKEGALGSKDFKSNQDVKRQQWWDWKPAKTALELLFWRGELMVTRRDNFHRIYDLTERVLPEGTDTSMPETDELGRFLVRRALKAQGIATLSDIVKHIHAGGRDVVKTAVVSLLEQQVIIPVSIEGDGAYYTLSDQLEYLPADSKGSRDVHILSPFDNLIILRDRLSRLFKFDYTLECYTPKNKRQYGYFVLPVLWGTEFVARLDPKADRKRAVLILRNLQF
ncbi:MAG: crosslink repair DNA glycosylase YcaQ family protein, partial [Candidatus Fermentibacteria bacterium]